MLSPGYILKDTYIVEGLHARGGMALVYRARHQELGITRALKVMQPQFAQDANFVQRFRREARIMATLRHPHIAEVVDFGTTPENWLYLVMEWLEGEDLRQVLGRTPLLPVAQVLSLSQQIASALDAAHRAGIVHRDLKPGNILMCRGPQGEQAKVVDFGVARQRIEGTAPTLPGTVMGTPGYMAPEQLLGQTDKIDGRSDQFALGVMLYEMLVGGRLFKFTGGAGASELYALAYRISQLELDPLPLSNSLVRSQVAQVLRRAMASSPESRFPTIAEFDAAFRAAFSGSDQTLSTHLETTAATTTTTRRQAGSARTQRLLYYVGVAVILIVWLGLAGYSLARHYRSATPTKPPVNRRVDAEPSVAPAPRSSAPILVIPKAPIPRVVKAGTCKASISKSIEIFDEPALSRDREEQARAVVGQCLKDANLASAGSTDIRLERTNYLHVMSSLDSVETELLEYCLRKHFTGRPPLRVRIKLKRNEEGACNAQ